MSEPEREDKDQLWSEATLWFARMRSPDAESFRPEFEEWLARGALHRRYYNRASEHWLHGTAAYAEERAKVHGQADSRPPMSPQPFRRKRALFAAGVAASLFVAGSAILVVAHHGGEREMTNPAATAPDMPPTIAQLATAAGEQRTIHLIDGSSVVLGSATMLRVQFARTVRRLELDRGRARFDVAHESRPFVVFAGGGSITAHGTMFDVGVTRDHRVSVRLIRGSVDVSFPPGNAPRQQPARRLHPGETVSFEAAGVAQSQGTDRSPSPAPAPGDPARDYRDVRAADLVDEANRRAAVPIRFAEPATGAKRVSGRFRTDDTAVLAERLAALFDLVVDQSRGTELVLRPR